MRQNSTAAEQSTAVPETLESSLQLSEAVLVDLGVPMGPVIASIHEKRDEFREQIREKARWNTSRSCAQARRKAEISRKLHGGLARWWAKENIP